MLVLLQHLLRRWQRSLTEQEKKQRPGFLRFVCKCVTAVCVQVTDYMLSNLNEIKYSKDFVGQIKFERGWG